MDDHIGGETIVNEGDVPPRGRGRPPIPVTEEVLERRRLSKQQANAARPKREGPSRKRGRPKHGVAGTVQGEEDLPNGAATSTQTSPLNSDASSAKANIGSVASRKRGRPPIVVTEEVLERRRLSKQRVNAARAKKEGPARKRGRPRRDVTGPIEHTHGLESSEIEGSYQRCHAAPSCDADHECRFSSVITLAQGEGPLRRRGRPRRGVTELIAHTHGLGTCEIQRSCDQRDDAPACQAPHECRLNSVISPSQGLSPTSISASFHAPSTESPIDSNKQPKRRGRPPNLVTPEVLERRRLSRKRITFSRPKGGDPLRKRGSPRPIISDNTRLCCTLSGPMIHHQDNNAGEASGSSAAAPSDWSSAVELREGAAIGSNLPLAERLETPQIRKSIDRKKKEFMESNMILNLGRQEETCGYCTAMVWSAEYTGRHVGSGAKGYSICCGKGKVQLPLLREPPPELKGLITPDGLTSNKYFSKSRVYNNIFAFCSFGGNVDHSVNKGKGPFVFRISGLTYHSLGSLVPPDGLTPKFAQLYMYDGQEAVAHRMDFSSRMGEVDPAIVTMLQGMLERENVLVGMFKQLRDRITGSQAETVTLRLLARRTSDGRLENIPTENDYEFAGLVVDNDFANRRDVVAEHKKMGLQHISDLHPSYMSLQYPLLFPYGEDGYRTNIKHRNADNSECKKNNKVSMREYYVFRAQYRRGEGHTIILGGRLFLQFIVDAWCSVEHGRLMWVRRHQSLIRSELYNNIVDSMRRGDVDATDVGKRVVLPSSFTGGYRYMQQNFQDSLALCKEFGHPDLFITFTCNPKWAEIQHAVHASGSHDASVHPDIVARVFKMKLDTMINDLTKKHVLGRLIGVVYTVEFQKRGLPHAHIVIWLATADKLVTMDDIDSVISAEIPDKDADPVGYQAVSQFMMHGPCGAANPKCPCMSNGQCTKHYPKTFRDATTLDDDGYAVYRRRDLKITVECNGIHLDNRHVVPYHRGLLVKYQGHINVEYCNRSLSIKYLFKYIGKGPDTAIIRLEQGRQHQHGSEDASSSVRRNNCDEVSNYLSYRYVSAAEASWRLFEFTIHYREPFVQRLYFHLENEQEVRFRDNETLPEVVRRVDPDGTMFIQWMLNNRFDNLGHNLTFTKYPTKFRWDSSAKRWFRRKQNVNVVGRMVYAHPASGERFYMRLLLNIVVGAKTFEEIRTVGGIVYPTHKEACFRRGLLDSDKEWHLALDDAALCATSPQLRDLFVTLLVFCEISNPSELWDKHWANLADDIQYTKRKMTQFPNLKISDADKQMLALEAMSHLLKQYGKKLEDFPGLPELNIVSTTRYKNDLLLEEMMYDREKLRSKASEGVDCFNSKQRLIFDEILESVHTNAGGFYFVYGPGGTGKTFLWSTILARLRSEGKIVLAVASSGIASLLIEGGRTAHSRFKIPIDPNEFTCCEIKQNTYLAELINNTSLVIWDEAPMTHRYVFEAVDRTFRDIRAKVHVDAQIRPFGGLTMLLGGDFRQILPVIPKKGREEIVAATISKSPLWQFCKIFKLHENMRIERDVPPITIQGKKLHFRDWVLALGDGLQETIALGDDLDPSWVRLPEELSLAYTGDPIETIVNDIYKDLHHMHGDLEYLRSRAILTPLNESVENVNMTVLQRLPGEFKEYKSCDTICKGSSNSEVDEVLYPPEYLNSLKFSGMPNHEIKVKIGAPIMLLRNLNAKKGLCNGTRLIITRCYPFLIEAVIITGKRIGETTYIPRITMCPPDKTLPFMLKRKQFPISVCYAMTVNKSQGQTVHNVGLYLPNPVFGHGQMYVAVSRVTSPAGLKIVTVDNDSTHNGYTKNIVYREIFDNLV
ncbi:uncharacterized protein LOC141677199 isoform X4 [Apium graveolens]|uniref:uncharacterized protein LOC141677199 isoform X4 n=1 Tax=Apium graveolens TaxID=4045 RepID=UPI003D78E6CD